MDIYRSSTPTPTELKEARRMRWLDRAADEAWVTAQKILAEERRVEELSVYADNPVGFCEEVLGDKFTDDMKQVMLSVRDNPITVVRSSTGPGKSHCAARVAVWFYRTYEDAKVYLTAAPPFENLRRILWGEVMQVVRKHEDLFSNDTIHTLSISRSHQSFITGVAIPTSGTIEQRVGKFSGKHAPHILFIVDEGDAVPDEVYTGIEGCLSGGLMPRLLVMFNPKAESGHVYQLERDGRAHVVHVSSMTHPNVTSGEQVIPGAVSREVVVRRVNEWTRLMHPDEKIDTDTFDMPDFLVGSIATATNGIDYPPLLAGKRKIIDPAFYYMVLGQYPAQSEQQLINSAWIDAARTRWDAYVAQHGEIPPLGVDPILGVDVAEYGVDANIACLRYAGYVARMSSWSGVDPDLTARRSLDLYLEKHCKIAMIDGTGVGAGVAPSMARLGREQHVFAMSVKLASSPSKSIKTEKGEFYQLRDQLWWACREWLRVDMGSMLPPDERLMEELRVARYKITNGKVRISSKDEMRQSLKRSPDRADALCLSFVPMERARVIRLSA